MSERFKYSKSGVYRIENFAQHLAQNTFPEVPIGTIGGINGWYIELEVIENETIAYPVIHCNNKPELYIHYYFNALGNGQSFIKFVNNLKLYETYGPRGHGMKILDILNEKNGYLDNGTLSIEYGIHIDGIQGVDGIWKFNFNDNLFNLNDNLTIEYMDPENGSLEVFYSHRQLLRFHSPLFQNEVTKFITRRDGKRLIEKCLQVAHGVRVRLGEDGLIFARIAHENKLRNVVQYADQQLVQHPWIPKNALDIPIYLFSNCMKSGLRHYLARLVNYSECLEDLKEIIQKLDIQQMSGEAMKTFTAKVFEIGN